MKKVSLLMMAAFVAASSVFVSCKKDEDPYIPKDGPEVTVTFGGDAVTSGSTVTVKIGDAAKSLVISYTADGGIQEIDLTIDGTSKTVSFTPNGTSASFTESISFDLAAAKNIAVSTTITDNQVAASAGLPDALTSDLTKSFSFTIKVEENPLSEAEEFTLVYKSGTQTDGENINETVGIRYQQNPTASTARFVLQATENNFVPLATKAEFDAIITKEKLKAKYNADVESKGVTQFERSSDAAFQPFYFISKVENNYFLVEMKSLNFAPGNNRAVFSYRE